MPTEQNPLGLQGIEFTEFATNDNDFMHQVFVDFGFSMIKKHATKDIIYYKQNNINFFLNKERAGLSAEFAKSHGPAICSMGWRVEDAEFAFKAAVERGAKPATDAAKDMPYPAIFGIGQMIADANRYVGSLKYPANWWQGDDESEFRLRHKP